MSANQQIIDKEVTFGTKEELVSTTDLRGVITYANEAFCRVAGYTFEELVGQNHNMVRHPDMPKAAFKDMWEKLKAGKHWRGAVKNRCKDGCYYWVDAFVTPIYEEGELIGYQSVRTVLDKKYRQNAEQMYARLNRQQSIEHWYNHVGVRHTLFFILALLIIAAAYRLEWVAVCLIPLPFIVYYNELFAIPRYFRQLRANYDSPSRWIYSGQNAQSISDFHMHIYQGRVRTIVGRIIDSTRPLHSASEVLASAATHAREGVEKESSELHQVSTAMEQMVQTIDDIAKNSQHTSSKVDEARDSCQSANHVMTETMGRIQELAAEVSQSAASAHQLTEEADKIGSIMQEIQGIAEQTNLLALNAAIEAARAGEQGRGFAVVADEVRALSQRTHKATEQIQTSIGEIQNMLMSWSATMQESKTAADSCVEQTQQTQQAVGTVFSSISEIADLTTQISTAAEEQNAVAQEINRNVTNINHVAEDNLSEVGQIEQATQDIEERTDKLASLGLTFGN